MEPATFQQRRPHPRSGIAERIWNAAREEFSRRGYHGARVQGIARAAACNVALMYRHWASKRALYLDVLRSVWLGAANEMARLLEDGAHDPAALVAAYLDAMLRDPAGAKILVREYLDGAPFLSQLAESDATLQEPVRRAAAALGGATGVDPAATVVTIGGLAALVATSREAVLPFVREPIAPDAWRSHVIDLLVNGLAPPAAPAPRPGANGANGVGA